MVKKLLVLLELIIVLVPFVLAYDLSDFPEPFIQNKEHNFISITGNNPSDIVSVSDLVMGLLSNYNITPPCAPCPTDQAARQCAVQF